MAEVVYLLHFSHTYRHCRHYLGWTQHLPQRLKQHLSARGTGLTRAAVTKGIGLQLVRTWQGDRQLEQRLRKRKNSPRLCPICNPALWQKGTILLPTDESQVAYWNLTLGRKYGFTLNLSSNTTAPMRLCDPIAGEIPILSTADALDYLWNQEVIKISESRKNLERYFKTYAL